MAKTNNKPSRPPLWPGDVSISVLGVTGDYATGKTLFLLSIDPANTRLYDFEKSAGTYSSLGFDRVDMPAVMLEKHPKGYSPRQLFEWWLNDINQISPGGGPSVIAVDPISDLEDGLVDHVKSRYREWGFKSEEAFVSLGGIFWSRVKSVWKTILSDLSTKCETFAFSTHLRYVWKYGKPTNQQEPKGKSTLMELSSLFLFLERESGTLIPSATVLKSRLASTSVKNGEVRITPTLPPRIPQATPKRIREYILAPPDYSKLSSEETEQEKHLSEGQKLELELQIAGERRAAEEAALKTAETTAKNNESIASAREAALAIMRPKKEAPPQNDAAADTSDTVGHAAVFDAIVPERDLMELIIESGKLVEAARGVYQTLLDRDVDVSGFSGADCLIDYLPLLNEDEVDRIKKWLASD